MKGLTPDRDAGRALPQPDSRPLGRTAFRHLGVAALLACGTMLLYAQVSGHQFLYFDDDQYVTHNPWVRRGLSWQGLHWAATTLHFANWHPLTWVSHMLDVQFFGLNPGGHHLSNAVIHSANASLLFFVLTAMTGALWRSAFVAALFAVHPLHVESVAWVAERKDVLSTFFGLSMLCAYAWHARRPGIRRLGLVAIFFALSLLAKPMWVTAPFLLLLLDCWPLRRLGGLVLDAGSERPPPQRFSLRRLVLEKWPLLGLSALSSAVTVVAQQRGGALVPVEAIGFGERLGNALVSYVRYVGKTSWPTSLSPFYPLPLAGPPLWEIVGATTLLAGITAFALVRLRRSPWLTVGWFWFLGTLVPVIGIVQVGEQAMADRYTYVPIVGLFIAATWECRRLGRSWPRGLRAVLRAAAVAGVLLLAGISWRQLGFWVDQETLFRHALAVTEPSGRAHLVLSQALAEKGRYTEAVFHASEASRLDPGNPRAHKNLGFVLYRLGRVDEAIAELRRAIALRPDYAEAHGNLGIAYGKKGWTGEAMKEMALEAKLRAEQAQR